MTRAAPCGPVSQAGATPAARLDPHATVFVTGLWRIEGGVKRTSDHYRTLLPGLCALLRGCRLIAHSDSDEIFDLFARHAEAHEVALTCERIAIEDLPGHDAAGRLARNCAAMRLDAHPRPAAYHDEKGVIHYWRDHHDGGAEAYRRLLSIWCSKVPLMAAHAARGADAQAARFVWVDASVARFNERRENWNFRKAALKPDALCHYASSMRSFGAPLPLNASFLCADEARWRAVSQLFARMLECAFEQPYAHDEETVLAACVRETPELFFAIGAPHGPRRPREGWRRLLSRLR